MVPEKTEANIDTDLTLNKENQRACILKAKLMRTNVGNTNCEIKQEVKLIRIQNGTKTN